MSEHLTNLKNTITPEDKSLGKEDQAWFTEQAEKIIRDVVLPHFELTEYTIISNKFPLPTRIPKNSVLKIISISKLRRPLRKSKKYDGNLEFKFKIPKHKEPHAKLILCVKMH